MTRTELLQEIRRMRFDEAYEGWCEGRLSQEEAARLLGVREPVPLRRTPRGEKRYPRAAGSVACDEPETGRRWITRCCSLQCYSRIWLGRCAMPTLLEFGRRQVSQRGVSTFGVVVANVLD